MYRARPVDEDGAASICRMSTRIGQSDSELSRTHFADLEDAIQSLTCNLPRWLCRSPGFDHEIAHALIGVFEISELQPNTSSRRIMFAPKRWVIRNQDIALLDSLGTILQGTATLAALAFATGTALLAPLAPAMAILYQLLKTAMVMRSKGVVLEQLDFQVLCVLREQPSGLTASETRKRLAKGAHVVDTGQVQACLERLAKYPSRTGEVALAWQGADNRWRSKDV